VWHNGIYWPGKRIVEYVEGWRIGRRYLANWHANPVIREDM